LLALPVSQVEGIVPANPTERPRGRPGFCREDAARWAVGAALTLDNEDNDNVESTLEAELARLKQEHRDLDTAIDALERVVTGDQLQIQRLKKRKLVLKDRVQFIEDQLTPDIIA
jgi:hypothetical protein